MTYNRQTTVAPQRPGLIPRLAHLGVPIVSTSGSSNVPTPPARNASFDGVYRSIADVQGWMTRDQACRLWDRAGELEPGERVVEIGSFQGRSMIVLASSAPEGVELIAIDPHGGNDRGPQELDGFVAEAEGDHETFLSNLREAGVGDRVIHLRKFSDDALDDVPGAVDLLYVDGAHRYGPAVADIRSWGAKVVPGGRMLVHDSFSSVGVTLALIATTLIGPHWLYEGRSQTMSQFRRAQLTPIQRLRNAGRQTLELPYFARNLLVKVLIVCHLRAATKLLGSNGEWPY